MTPFEMVLRKLRIAGIFILLSLIVEIISLVWNHPLSFTTFLIAGTLLLAARMVPYIFDLVFTRATYAEKAE
ncbi:MAG: hypothetical protein DMG65_25170 [Candidatus Angelobacter sp. Gp1-AA117]|nr:MAG: hypothetical protein DMG65_25170 [Candidatus Angelobacter sp. Gp1-AA117]